MVGCDFACYSDMGILNKSLYCHTAAAVMAEAVGDDSVRNLVADFIWVPARHLFASKQHNSLPAFFAVMKKGTDM
jgi:hypothetical protein